MIKSVVRRFETVLDHAARHITDCFQSIDCRQSNVKNWALNSHNLTLRLTNQDTTWNDAECTGWCRRIKTTNQSNRGETQKAQKGCIFKTFGRWDDVSWWRVPALWSTTHSFVIVTKISSDSSPTARQTYTIAKIWRRLKTANTSNPNLKYLLPKKNKSHTVLCSCPALSGTEGYQKACKVFLNFIWPRPSRCSTPFLSPPSTLCRQSQARVRLI